MSVTGARHTAQPVFKKCARCEYSLRGLPANHRCPECGLRFDEGCALYRASNPREVLFAWIAIFGGGISIVRYLPHLANLAAANTRQKIFALAAIPLFFVVAVAVWFQIRRYRRGYEVAVTGDGLILRLPHFEDDLIPWDNIGGAWIKTIPKNKPQIALVLLSDKQKEVQIGGQCNVFPKWEDVDRFVDQVSTRVRSVKGDGAA